MDKGGQSAIEPLNLIEVAYIDGNNIQLGDFNQVISAIWFNTNSSSPVALVPNVMAFSGKLPYEIFVIMLIVMYTFCMLGVICFCSATIKKRFFSCCNRGKANTEEERPDVEIGDGSGFDNVVMTERAVVTERGTALEEDDVKPRVIPDMI